MDVVFQKEFRQDITYWVQHDRKTSLRILKLIEAIIRNPTEGIGKPERLKHIQSNVWSRRITQEHRIVYKISEDRIDFLQARLHY